MQVFLRLSGCNLACSFCDTKRFLKRVYSFEVQGGSGSGGGSTRQNPVRPHEVAEIVDVLNRAYGPIHSVCVTGGEPLLQESFLSELLPLLRERGFRIYLETNGTLPEALATVLPWVEFVSLDFKLPSSTGENGFWKEHESSLRQCRERSTFVKLVVTSTTDAQDVLRAGEIVARADPSTPVVLQPESTALRAESGNSVHLALEMQRLLSKNLGQVRVIGQVHRFLGLR